MDKDIIIRNGDIIVFKSKGWGNFIKLIGEKSLTVDKVFRLGIRLVTLSSYTHTASIVKLEDGKLYFVSSTYSKGVHSIELYLPWLQGVLARNEADLFRPETVKPKELITKFNSMNGLKYSYLGILNLLTSTFKLPKFFNVKDKMFCSEFTSTLHELSCGDKLPSDISPRDIAQTDELKRIY